MAAAVKPTRTFSLVGSFFVTVTAAAILSVAVLGYLWVDDIYDTFDVESQKLRETFLDEQKTTVRGEVEKALDYTEYRHSRTQEVLRSSLRDRVYEAEAIASSLVASESGRRSRAALERLVIEALRPIRFNNGRGYYFMVTMKGVEKLYPVAPEFENQNLLGLQDAQGNFVIRNEIDLLRAQPEGFVFDHWRKPGQSDGMVFPKMTFVKRFEPFDWYIGTGEYLDDFEHDLQEELLDRIAQIRFGTEGYVFIDTFAGDALLMDGHRVTTPANNWDLTAPDGSKVIQIQHDVAVRPDGGFVTYTWNRLTRPEPSRKISYVKAYPQWRWVVGASVYLDEVEEVIEARRHDLAADVRTRVLQIAGILGGLCLFVGVIAASFSRLTKRHFDAFTTFFARAATGSETIDEAQLRFGEFKSLARSANAMIADRERAEEANRDLQEELLRARKMEALGLLTGGVAHDLNNILSGLVLIPDMLLMELPPDSRLRRRVETIKDAGQRAAAVVADLLAASRGGRGAVEVMNLNQEVERFVKSPEFTKLSTTHDEVVVATALDPKALNVRCSRAQLGKAMLNLVANAAEAIEGPGTVTITTENRYVEDGFSGYEAIPAGEYVVLAVADTGTGVTDDDLRRIFEPFFTKKILGRT
jgi:signal transduction histidine kinase